MTKTHADRRSGLMDEHPLLVYPSLAADVGILEAIVLQQLHWLLGNPTNGKEISGERWLFNTYAAWRSSYFPFITERTLRRTFENLESMRLLVSCQPEGGISRRKYYRIDYNAYSARRAKLATSKGQNGHLDRPNRPVPLTETSSKITSKTRPACASDVRPLPEQSGRKAEFERKKAESVASILARQPKEKPVHRDFYQPEEYED